MISVILPTYNSESTLSIAVNSILKQTFREFELLVIDDGSTDNTEIIINSFRDSRIKVFKTEHQGLPKILNLGISLASNNFIARMDADDIALSTRFEEQIKAIKKYDFVSSWFGVVNNNNKLLYIIKNPTSHDEIRDKLALHSVFCHPAAMYRKDAIVELGGYSDTCLEDYDLWLRAINKFKFYNIPQILLFYRMHKRSITGSTNLKSYHYSLQDKYYKDLTKCFGIENPLEQKLTYAWREFFYGDKGKARRLWTEKSDIQKDLRIIIAKYLTFLPKPMFEFMLHLRIRQRLDFFMNFLSKDTKAFKTLLKEIVETH